MRPIPIRPLSALAGVAVSVLSFFALGAAQSTSVSPGGSHLPFPPGGGGVPLIIDNPLQVLGVPTPQQMMRIVEGTPFTVPAGKLFVATGAGTTAWGSGLYHTTAFDGVDVLQSRLHLVSGMGASTVVGVPPGLVAPGGTVVTCDATTGAGVLLGYLADA